MEQMGRIRDSVYVPLSSRGGGTGGEVSRLLLRLVKLLQL